jgi:hypothetical protein
VSVRHYYSHVDSDDDEGGGDDNSKNNNNKEEEGEKEKSGHICCVFGYKLPTTVKNLPF